MERLSLREAYRKTDLRGLRAAAGAAL